MSLIQNKKLHLNYTVSETFEAGIKLLGNEVKSIRSSQAQIDGAKIIIRGGEAFIVGMSISPYQNHDKVKKKIIENDRTRKLILNKSEILKLAVLTEKGFNLQAEKVYDKHGIIKLQIAVCKRKNKQDKRETIKKKDLKRSGNE